LEFVSYHTAWLESIGNREYEPLRAKNARQFPLTSLEFSAARCTGIAAYRENRDAAAL
jgi:hypothetical protein